jgi:hypothetical protein
MKKFAALLTLLVIPSAAFAANTSVYTKYNLDKCPKLDVGNTEEGDSGSWLCKGYGNLKIYFAEGDLRDMVAFGKSPKDHCAAHQTFSGFNSVKSTIEWRLNKGKPIAAIQRWTVSYDPEDSAKTKTWLVVTRIESGNSCHMAVIEGALPNANIKAREIADSLAEKFECGVSSQTAITLPTTDKAQANIADDSCEKY